MTPLISRELLTQAAKAARIKIDTSPYNGGGRGNTGFDVLGNAVLDWHNDKTWNPLADDGDAMRLASRLNISTYITNGVITAKFSQGREVTAVADDFDGDKDAAMRCAIVRAAAEIGKRA